MSQMTIKDAGDLGLVYLVRHGETPFNKSEGSNEERIRGWLDVPLDKNGIAQAKEAAKFFKDKDVAKIYSSDLSRAIDTAKEIARVTKNRIEKTTALRPWNLGHLQGVGVNVAQHFIKEYIEKRPTEKVPGGESFDMFEQRYLPFLQTQMDWARTHQENVVLVTHFRDVKLAEAYIKGWPNGVDLKVLQSDSVKTGDILEIKQSKVKPTYRLIHV